jgi:hypothetical protein
VKISEGTKKTRKQEVVFFNERLNSRRKKKLVIMTRLHHCTVTNVCGSWENEIIAVCAISEANQ